MNKNICKTCGLYQEQTEGMTAGEHNEYGCICKEPEIRLPTQQDHKKIEAITFRTIKKATQEVNK